MKKIKIAFYDTHSYDRESFDKNNEPYGFQIDYFDCKLNEKTASMSKGYDVACIFVNDVVDEKVSNVLKENGVRIVALRCTGYDNVDMNALEKANIEVVRVPSYSPHSVAEHAVSLLLALTRHLSQSFARTKSGNFSLDGLTGRDLFGLTAGIVGTGKIGKSMALILKGLGMNVILYDPFKDHKWAYENRFRYAESMEEFFTLSDVISLHCPLTEDTFHFIGEKTLSMMKNDAVIINTGRGALIDSNALINSLKENKIGGAAIDVYEKEDKYFFSDWSNRVIEDDGLVRLLSFPNVVITSHQAFLTQNALSDIAKTILEGIKKNPAFLGKVKEI